MIEKYRLKSDNVDFIFFEFVGEDAAARRENLQNLLIAEGATIGSSLYVTVPSGKLRDQRLEEICEPILTEDDHVIVLRHGDKSIECSFVVRQRTGDGIRISSE